MSKVPLKVLLEPLPEMVSKEKVGLPSGSQTVLSSFKAVQI